LLGGDRQRFTKQLSESTDSMGSTKARLDSINIQMARLEAETTGMLNSISEGRKLVAAMEEELHSKNDGISGNSVKISDLSKRLAPLEETIKKAKIKPEEFKSNPERIKELSMKVETLERELSSKAAEISKTGAELSILANLKAAKTTELDSTKQMLESRQGEAKELDALYTNRH